MSRTPYVVRCGCQRPARYKIAAVWSDGTTCELKTYALACDECLTDAYRAACQRRDGCRLSPGETLERPWVYELACGCPSGQLHRRAELEILAEEASV
jgi:hypothetical protein